MVTRGATKKRLLNYISRQVATYPICISTRSVYAMNIRRRFRHDSGFLLTWTNMACTLMLSSVACRTQHHRRRRALSLRPNYRAV